MLRASCNSGSSICDRTLLLDRPGLRTCGVGVLKRIARTSRWDEPSAIHDVPRACLTGWPGPFWAQGTTPSIR